MNKDLNNQVAIVTGASSGIGRGIAIELAKVGMKVKCLARREEKLKEVTKIINENGGCADYYVADITNSKILKEIIDDIILKEDELDLLVNCAGQNKAIGETWDLNPDDLWNEIEINTKGTVVLTNLATKQMVKQKFGRIINLCGGGTTRPHVYASAYSASKAAIARFTETVAIELKNMRSPVKVFAFSPGLVLNDRTIDLANSNECKKYWPHLSDMIKNRECRTPDMVGEFVCFIARGEIDAYSGRHIQIAMDKEKLIEEANSLEDTDKHTLRVIR